MLNWQKVGEGDIIGPGFVKFKILKPLKYNKEMNTWKLDEEPWTEEEYICTVGIIDSQTVHESQYKPYNVPYIGLIDHDGECDSTEFRQITGYIPLPQLNELTEDKIEQIINALKSI